MRLLAWPRTLAITAALTLLCGGARGADMPGITALPLPTQTNPLPRADGVFGWYLRGDLGYRLLHIGTASSSDATQVPAPASSKLDNNIVGGYGIGYQWDWLRFDVTGDYGGRNKYTGTTAGGATLTGQVETFTALVNGYVDLGTWSKLTPYVSGGIAGAYVAVSNYSNPAAVAPMPSAALAEHRWNLAWAATAGISYNVTRDFLIDASYRHIDMGDASGGPSRDLTIKHLSGDEIRLGFPYILD